MTGLQRTFVILSIALLLVLVYLLRPILLPFLVGIALAYLGDPLVDRLERLKLGRTVGVLIVFLIFLAILIGGLLVLVPLLVREVSGLVQDIPRFIAWLQETASPFLREKFGVDPFDIRLVELREELARNWRQAGGIAGRIVAEVTQSGMMLIAWAVNLALIPVVAFYLMRDWDDLMEKARGLIPRDKEPMVVGLVSECDEVLSAFLRGQLMVMLLLGCIYAAGLYLVGLDLAILIGLLAGLASIVPYLGFVVGIVAASAAAIFQFQDPVVLVYVAIVFGVGQMLEGMVLTPLLVGDRIGLHPVAVIFAIMAGGQLFGFVGILLALPAAAVIMVFVRHVHQQYKASEIYESSPE
ncbi:MAG: AI-2E family transporter [Pseudomonadales bacterium]|nr:AI-2E family transporter [Pseudomonadales bacterium]